MTMGGLVITTGIDDVRTKTMACIDPTFPQSSPRVQANLYNSHPLHIYAHVYLHDINYAITRSMVNVSTSDHQATVGRLTKYLPDQC